MDIEFLSSRDSGFMQKPLTVPYGKLLIDNPWVRAYKIDLAKSEQLNLKKHPSAFVLVSLTTGMVSITKNEKAQNASLQEASFFWIKADEPITVLNQSDNIMQFALVEVK